VQISPFGHGAGCDFVLNDCIVNGGEIPDYSRGYFCNNSLEQNNNGQLYGDLTCDPSHTHKAFCDLSDQGPPVPEEYQYFNNKNLQPGLTRTDFCPTANVGVVDCTDITHPTNTIGETFGEQSKCFNFKSKAPLKAGATCLQSVCNISSRRLEILINDRKIECKEDFEEHEFLEMFGYVIECPRLASVCPHFFCPDNCSGRGLCNFYHFAGPRCVCFNENDHTHGCYKTKIKAPEPGSTTCIPEQPNPFESWPVLVLIMSLVYFFIQKVLSCFSPSPKTKSGWK